MNKPAQPIKGRPYRRGPARPPFKYGPKGGNHGGARVGLKPNTPPPVPKISQSAAANVKMPDGVVFYCKSCQQIVDYKPDNFAFKPPIANCLKEKSTSSPDRIAEMVCDIAFGTERSIKHFYKIRDEKFDQERKEKEEKALRADKL